MSRADVIVVGLGAVGSAATLHLARQGKRVLGFDTWSPPHSNGSSHGETRITRLACGEGPEYTQFARRSHEIWRELEAMRQGRPTKPWRRLERDVSLQSGRDPVVA